MLGRESLLVAQQRNQNKHSIYWDVLGLASWTSMVALLRNQNKHSIYFDVLGLAC